MSAPADPIRVLHVDDDPEFRQLAAERLEAEDDRLEVDTAGDAEAGLARLDSGDYDCVVSDYEMPGRDGLAFLADVRETHDDLPFVLFTGQGSEAVASEAISAGVTDYLQKRGDPSQFAVLANRLTNLVGRARATAEIQATRRRYQRLIEESSDVIVTVGIDGTFRYLSPAVPRVLGYEADELVGENGFDYVHPDDRDATMAQFDTMLSDPTARPTAEFRFDHKDGSWRWLEARGRNLLDDPVVEGLVVYVRDITDRKAVETDLRATRDRMEFALDVTDSVIYDLDLGSNREQRHGPFERLYSVPEPEVRTLEAFYERAVHPADRETLESRQADVIEGRSDAVEVAYRTNPDAGPVSWIHSTMARTGDGAERLVGLATDITDLKEREAELERQNERLDEFVRLVSHDLRNPLSVASGRLELARQEADSDHLAAVEQAHERMQAMLAELLTLAKAGEAASSVEPVDLAATVAGCWRNVETSAAALVTDTAHVIEADAKRLQRLLENLFRNAVEHGSTSHRTSSDDAVEHGSTGSRQPAGDGVTVTVGDLDDGFYVEDDGPGIPEGRRDAVFEPGTTTLPTGSGFGLSIVQKIADAHGWSVRATDGTDGGARIEVTGVDIVEPDAGE